MFAVVEVQFSAPLRRPVVDDPFEIMKAAVNGDRGSEKFRRVNALPFLINVRNG